MHREAGEVATPTGPGGTPRIALYAAMAGVLLLAAALRVVNLSSEWLWYDELLTVTFSRIPILQLLDPMLPDPHPPLYYLQLRYWLELGTSDVWIVLNPVLWSVGSVASLLFTAHRIYGARVALTGAVLLAISPIALMFAHETRMYSMMMFLMIWAWYFNHRFVSGASMGPAAVVGIIASETCVALSHATGPFAISFVYVYTLLLAWQEAVPRSRLVHWAVVHLAVGTAMILALPYFAKGPALLLAGGFSYLIVPSSMDVVQTLTDMLFGLAVSGAWIDLATSLVLSLVLLAALRDSSSRPLVLSLVVAPLLATVSISHLWVPVWHVRTVVFVCPFIALTIARAVWGARQTVRGFRGVASSVALVFLGALVAGQLASGIAQMRQHPIKGIDVKQTVADVRQRLRPGDVIYVPHPFDYWCFAWYFFGPDMDASLSKQGAVYHGGNYFAHGKSQPKNFRDRTVWVGRVFWRPAVVIDNYTKVDTLGSEFQVDQHVPTGQ